MRPVLRTLTFSMLAVVACLGLLRAGASAMNEDAKIAGLVVDFGDGRTAYALVPFTGDELTGMNLLESSGVALVTLDFGGVGAGICMIEDVGCDVSECRLRLCQTSNPDSPFWRLMQSGADGDWSFAPLGISSARLGDGDVNGWFWSGTSPAGQAPTVDDIASRLGLSLDTLRSATPPEPTLRIFGQTSRPHVTNDPWAIAAGAAVLGGIVLAGSWAVHRSRGLDPA